MPAAPCPSSKRRPPGDACGVSEGWLTAAGQKQRRWRSPCVSGRAARSGRKVLLLSLLLKMDLCWLKMQLQSGC